ncbi:thermonuclease family protein [Siculibacillus lacustris]|uniref:Thermonuclease family protein n=1 Tax=Siculibacillus lacustris TaxID=1549641 RepID=A0A4Q9VZU2_9HYPH|nr:thermonuclease family protein [Siculibacillus lacustris]TBW41034.1 thermonuclease family protein [Siculibacillus lacustris]
MSEAAAPASPPRAVPRRRRRSIVAPLAWSAGFGAVSLLFVSASQVAGGPSVRSASPPSGETAPPPRPGPTPAPSAQPVWVPTPMRIDRKTEERQRIAPSDDTTAPRLSGRAGLPADDGAFPFAGGRARIDGLAPPERRRLCTGESGARWACGLRAHTMLVAMINGQDLVCRPKSENADTAAVQVMSDCRSRGRSIAETLVGEGWVDLDPGFADPALLRLHATAVERGRGLWAKEPPP